MIRRSIPARAAMWLARSAQDQIVINALNATKDSSCRILPVSLDAKPDSSSSKANALLALAIAPSVQTHRPAQNALSPHFSLVVNVSLPAQTEHSSQLANANNATRPAANAQMKLTQSAPHAHQDTSSAELAVSANVKMVSSRTPLPEHAMLAVVNAVSAQMQRHALLAPRVKFSKAHPARLRNFLFYI